MNSQFDQDNSWPYEFTVRRKFNVRNENKPYLKGLKSWGVDDDDDDDDDDGEDCTSEQGGEGNENYDQRAAQFQKELLRKLPPGHPLRKDAEERRLI